MTAVAHVPNGRTVGGRVQLFARKLGDPVSWRLLSNNNREIGRGLDSFADADSCHVAVKELQNSLDRLEPMIKRADAHRWIWVLADDGRAVIASAHRFDRQIRCTLGLAHFQQEMRVAVIVPEVMTSSARRWRGSIA